ncbi:MAG: ArsC family reductase [Gallionella sp.]
MRTLYGIPNCNTVKKSRDWLADHAVEYAFHDFKKHGLTAEIAQNWLTQCGWEALINRKGLTWRGLTDAEKAAVCDNTSALSLMLTKTSVIKRPILEQDGKVLCVGFDEAKYLAVGR